MIAVRRSGRATFSLGGVYYTGIATVWQSRLAKPAPSTYNAAGGEVTELADVHDLGSCGATRAGSSPAFPTTK